jgi:hypothetical protein
MKEYRLKTAPIVLFVASLCAGCFSPPIGDGHLKCAAGNQCPPGFQCACDQRCYRPGVGPGNSCTGSGGGDDMGAPDMTQGPGNTPAAVWTSGGGGTSTSASGARLGISIGGPDLTGTVSAKSGASATFGYFGSGTK